MSSVPDQAAWIKGSAAVCSNLPLAPSRTWRIVLLGAPGIGKGTQAELLCRRLGACHLSTGDVFRAIRYSDEPLSPAMQKALDQMNRGALVTDDTVLEVIHEREKCITCRYGFVLDGFPRTVPQAQKLDEMFAAKGIELDAVVDFELPREQIIARLSGRRTCPQCRETYHLENRPPKVPGKCDACGSELTQRSDDRPEAIRVRLAAYEELTAPLQQYYQARGQLITIEAEGTPRRVHERVVERLACV